MVELRRNDIVKWSGAFTGELRGRVVRLHPRFSMVLVVRDGCEEWLDEERITHVNGVALETLEKERKAA